ncbi:hypothetical protein HDE_04342 [Halotydeus destructor]|nr:hypothetical protein HDE_04342 [Halotydeus destructor]
MMQFQTYLFLVIVVSSSFARLIDTPTDVLEHIDSILSTEGPRPAELFEYEMKIRTYTKHETTHYGGKLILEFQSKESNSMFEVDAEILDDEDATHVWTLRMPIGHRKLKSIKATFVSDHGYIHLAAVNLKPLFAKYNRPKHLNTLCSSFDKHELNAGQSWTQEVRYCYG